MWRENRIGFGDDELFEWLMLLEAGDNEAIRKELEVRAMDNPALQEAMEKWEDLSRDPAAIREYEMRHKMVMDRLAAIREHEYRQQERYEQGKAEGKVEIARKMVQRNMDAEIIAELSGLSVEEVRRLKIRE